MRPSARSALLPWLAKFEGEVSYMYLDRKGLVSTGIGTKIDSPAAALRLQWTWVATGELASASAVQAEWTRVKAMQHAKGFDPAFADSARLAVTQDSLAAYTDDFLAGQEEVLRRTIPNWDDRPAVVQLARLRTSYADGAGSPWPKLDAAITAGEWDVAADESQPGDLATQNAAYRASYRAVLALYGLAAGYPGDELPLELPDGSEVADTDPAPAS